MKQIMLPSCGPAQAKTSSYAPAKHSIVLHYSYRVTGKKTVHSKHSGSDNLTVFSKPKPLGSIQFIPKASIYRQLVARGERLRAV